MQIGMEPWWLLARHTRHMVIAHGMLRPANVPLLDLEKVRLAFKVHLTRLKHASRILLRAAPTLTRPDTASGPRSHLRAYTQNITSALGMTREMHTSPRGAVCCSAL